MKKRTVENDTLVITDEAEQVSLSIRETFENQEARFWLCGRITSELAHDFEDELLLAAGVCSRMALDFSGVDGISSGGLKTLLTVQKLLDGRPDSSLKLLNLKENVWKTFQELGFSELFDIER